MTTNFKEPPPAGWKEALPQDASLKGNWWEMFGDPQLNALEEQVNGSNFTIAVTEAQFRAARAAITVARSALFPTLTIGVTATSTHIPNSPTSNTTVFTTSGGASNRGGTFAQTPIDLTYEVDAWGRIRNTIAANVATAEASAADVETIRLSTHAELAVDYFELRGADEQQRLLQASVAAYEEALVLTTNRFNQGVASQVDVEQAQAQLDTTRAQLTDVGVLRAQLEHAIAILIGKPPADLNIAFTPIGTTEPPVVPVSLPSALLERRPDIAGAERRMAFANAEIGIAKAAYYPTISLSASTGFENTQLASLLSAPFRVWSLGASLSEIAFDAGRRTALTAQARANFEGAVATYRQTVITSFQDVEDNLAALRILGDESQQQTVAVESSQRLLDLAMNRYRGGITTYLEVITAQNTLLSNQRTSAAILTRRMTSAVLLIKALGGGWDRSQLPL